jgi:ABC-2 type transport system ATP-binding protein
MDEAEYCHRISIMVEGKIADVGAPRELKARWKVKTIQEVFIALVEGTRKKT